MVWDATCSFPYFPLPQALASLYMGQLLRDLPRCHTTFSHSSQRILCTDFSCAVSTRTYPRHILFTLHSHKFNTGFLIWGFFHSQPYASKPNNWQSGEVSCLVAWIQRIQTMALLYIHLPSSSCLSSCILPVVLMFYHIFSIQFIVLAICQRHSQAPVTSKQHVFYLSYVLSTAIFGCFLLCTSLTTSGLCRLLKVLW